MTLSFALIKSNDDKQTSSKGCLGTRADYIFGAFFCLEFGHQSAVCNNSCWNVDRQSLLGKSLAK